MNALYNKSSGILGYILDSSTFSSSSVIGKPCFSFFSLILANFSSASSINLAFSPSNAVFTSSPNSDSYLNIIVIKNLSKNKFNI